jgi:hypothetical protein
MTIGEQSVSAIIPNRTSGVSGPSVGVGPGPIDGVGAPAVGDGLSEEPQPGKQAAAAVAAVVARNPRREKWADLRNFPAEDETESSRLIETALLDDDRRRKIVREK